MKKIIPVIFGLMVSFQCIQAQSTNNLSRTELVKESTSSQDGIFALVLTIDKGTKVSSVDISSDENLFRDVQSAEDKFNLKYALEAFQSLQKADSFIEVINASSGFFELFSHEALNSNDKATHYFVFKF